MKLLKVYTENTTLHLNRIYFRYITNHLDNLTSYQNHRCVIKGGRRNQAKTGSGPILLTFSFPYVRDWLNEHPFRNEPAPCQIQLR